MQQSKATLDIAILIPCLNEAAAIARVVRDFNEHLPGARIYVYDNGSTDGTADIAASAGATVRQEPHRGKGNVVRRMFADIEADIYVLVDGDDTYDAASAPKMIDHLRTDQLDMVVGRRVDTGEGAYRPGHRLGNRLLTGVVAWLFGRQTADMLSGYRVFSRRFVKTFPALSTGFETETELTVHALDLRLPIADLDTPYGTRPVGSESKLNTIGDSLQIMKAIFNLVKDERPLAFFATLALILLLGAAILMYPIILEYLATGLVPRFPTVILAAAMGVSALLSLASGLILDTVTNGRREAKRLAYLSFPGPKPLDAQDPKRKPASDGA